VKIYVVVVDSLMKKERRDEIFCGKTSLGPSYFVQ
jgi:hypothetical protein